MADEQQFPIDWTEWDKAWHAWTQAHAMRRSHARFPGKNFLADEVLGVYSMNGRAVELSAVTFPDLGSGSMERKRRYVGITWLGDDGSTINGGLASTFADLDELLVSGPPA